MDATKHLDTLTSIWADRQRLDEQEYRAVKRARLAGASWAEVGDSLGISRQAVHERYTRLGVR
jgi:DNA invertase Pin-like site-specific DNA recombinase